MNKLHSLLLLVAVAFTIPAPAFADSKTTLTWYGHSAFKVVTPKGKVLVFDPWLSNPMNPDAKNGVNAVGNVDYILITHGHFDHVGETVELAKKTKAHLVTNFELGGNMVRLLGFPKDQAGLDTLGNIGGALPIADGEVVVNFVAAVHSSGLDAGKDQEAIAYGGNPVGFVIQIKNGPTIYDTGDTAFFGDMAQIGTKFHPDVALINIGGHFGMEPADAALAAKAVQAKLAIPHHYKTFPILTQSADGFFKALDQKKIAHLEMKPGQTVSFDGTKLGK
jgi:L-ascorbate metabolism protein UlaG (beta-lactamase superfamily)